MEGQDFLYAPHSFIDSVIDGKSVNVDSILIRLDNPIELLPESVLGFKGKYFSLEMEDRVQLNNTLGSALISLAAQYDNVELSIGASNNTIISTYKEIVEDILHSMCLPKNLLLDITPPATTLYFYFLTAKKQIQDASLPVTYGYPDISGIYAECIIAKLRKFHTVTNCIANFNILNVNTRTPSSIILYLKRVSIENDHNRTSRD